MTQEVESVSLDGPANTLRAQLVRVFPDLGNTPHLDQVHDWLIKNADTLLQNMARVAPASFSGGQPVDTIVVCLRPIFPGLAPHLLRTMAASLDDTNIACLWLEADPRDDKIALAFEAAADCW